MSDFNKLTNKPLEEIVDQIFIDEATIEDIDDYPPCNCWVTCENPRCFKHGCINALPKQAKGVRHV